MIRLADHLNPAHVIDLKSTTKQACLMELVQTLADAPEVENSEALLQAVLEREDIVSTGIGGGVAVPHAKIHEVTEFIVAYGRSREGVDFGAIDERPVHHIVLIGGPPDRQMRYLQFLAMVNLRLKRADLRRGLEQAAGPEEMHRLLVSD